MFIDTNTYLGQWPHRELPAAGPDPLLATFSHYGVEQAWVGSFDALLHKDLASVNARLVEDCGIHHNTILQPVGAVNPVLPRWEEDLRRCAEDHAMQVIRLHPAYHGYGLNDSRFTALLEFTASLKLLVQVVVTMEDERMMHPLMRVEHVDVAPLADGIGNTPGARLMLLNAFRAVRGPLIAPLVATGRVWFDIAWLEGIEGIAQITNQIPTEKLVFGSYAPFFYFESSLLKLKESGLTGSELEQIQGGNAEASLA